jgi:hypothetical protein
MFSSSSLIPDHLSEDQRSEEKVEWIGGQSEVNETGNLLV